VIWTLNVSNDNMIIFSINFGNRFMSPLKRLSQEESSSLPEVSLTFLNQLRYRSSIATPTNPRISWLDRRIGWFSAIYPLQSNILR
jgi:hypothetical protein